MSAVQLVSTYPFVTQIPPAEFSVGGRFSFFL